MLQGAKSAAVCSRPPSEVGMGMTASDLVGRGMFGLVEDVPASGRK